MGAEVDEDVQVPGLNIGLMRGVVARSRTGAVQSRVVATRGWEVHEPRDNFLDCRISSDGLFAKPP